MDVYQLIINRFVTILEDENVANSLLDGMAYFINDSQSYNGQKIFYFHGEQTELDTFFGFMKTILPALCTEDQDSICGDIKILLMNVNDKFPSQIGNCLIFLGGTLTPNIFDNVWNHVPIIKLVPTIEISKLEPVNFKLYLFERYKSFSEQNLRHFYHNLSCIRKIPLLCDDHHEFTSLITNNVLAINNDHHEFTSLITDNVLAINNDHHEFTSLISENVLAVNNDYHEFTSLISENVLAIKT